MERWKSGKNIDTDVYLNMLRKCSGSGTNAETIEGIHKLRKQKEVQMFVKVCEIVVFVFFTCAFLYSCKTLWDLKSEIGNLKEEIKSEYFLRDGFTDMLIREERDPSNSIQLSSPHVEENVIAEENALLKRKREIRLSDKNASEYSTFNGEKKSTPSMNSDSEEYSSEYSYGSSVKPYNLTTRKPRKTRNKSRKYYRYSVTPEKFFTDIESTTSTPIQVRQSRTKLTDDFQDHKYKKETSHKPLLQSYGSKESITREEALLRHISPHLITENTNELKNGIKSENDSNHSLSKPKEFAETTSYNIIMVHYAADTTHYTKNANPHYFGNGRMQMKSSIYKDWKPAHWTQGVDISKYFSLSEGKVAVSITGIYLIYAQVQYSNKQEVNGYSVIYNNQPIVQCITTSTHPDREEVKSNTCATSTTILLHSYDRIYLEDLHHGRHVVLTPEKSYFGLILLSPFKENK